MSSTPNPHDSSPFSADFTADVATFHVTRRMVAVLLVIIALRANMQLIPSLFTLATASPPAEIENGPLFGAELSNTFVQLYHHQITSSIAGIAFGIVLALLGVVAWKCQRIFFRAVDKSPSGLDAGKTFRRCALYAFAASCVGVVGPLVYLGAHVFWVSMIVLWGLDIFVLLGFCMSIFAGALGWDLRIRMRDAFLSYTFATLGVLMTSWPLVFKIIRPVRHLWWELQQWM